MIVLDTNVLSELMRAEPDERVVAWSNALPPSSQYTTAVNQAEILYGISLLPSGKRRSRILSAAQAMFAEDLAGRVLVFGADAAHLYARLAADRRRAGRPISHFDAQIAAITRASGASLATRNTADFEGCGIRVVNPWDERR